MEQSFGYGPPVAAQRFLILDGSGYIFRAYFALHQGRSGGRNIHLSNSSGMPTGALYVFTNMLMRLYEDQRPDLCAVVFDAPGRTFRHELDPEYKANRREKPEDLVTQLPWFEKIVHAFRLPVLAEPGVEADDVIATLAKHARAKGLDVTIVSGDKDLMQLVDDELVMVDSMRDVRYDVARVTEKFGVPPKLVSEFLALCGDSSDNISGMPGVGKKTAAKLLNEYGSIDALLDNTDKLKGKMRERFEDPEHLERLARSRKLVALRDDVPLERDIMSLGRQEWDSEGLRALFEELGFSNLLARVQPSFASDDETGQDIVDKPPPSSLASDHAAYKTVVNEEQLDVFLDDCQKEGLLSVAMFPPALRAGKGDLVGLGLATVDRAPVYVPLAHRYLGAPKQLAMQLVAQKISDVLADGRVALVVHDYKTTWRVLTELGATLPQPRCDTMLASYLYDASQTNHEIDVLAKSHLDYKTTPITTVFGKGRRKSLPDEVDVSATMRYASEAAHVIAALGLRLPPLLEKAGLSSLMHDIELPLSVVLAKMESAGICLRSDILRELGQKVGATCQALEGKIAEAAGEAINISSPKQLSVLLFERLGLRTDRMRKTTLGFSTDHATLDELRDAHPVVPLVIEYRELTKLKSTYLDALPPLVSPNTGRLHTSYTQTVASTGRLASTHPNIQNIPVRTELGREIRRAFVAKDGCVLVSADYSQIELRVLAHLSQDKVLCQAFADDVDVHAQTAAEVFDVKLDNVTKEQRRVAKAVNYGLGYGQTDFGLSRALDISRAQARQYIDTYFERFFGVKSFMEKHLIEARQKKVVTTILGRRLPIPGIAAKRYQDRSAAERLARNAPIQGSAADILKLAMLRLHTLFEEDKAPGTMLLTVHDELVFEVVEENADELAAIVRREMENAYALDVPLKVDLGVAKSWADAH